MFKKLLLFLLLFLGFFGISKAQLPNFKTIDKHALKAPKSVENNVTELAEYLAKSNYSELEKVRSFYTWIIYHITYDNARQALGEKRKHKSRTAVLKTKKAICSEYAELFKALCEEVGITAYVVSGYSKGTLTESPNLEAPDHAWNVVKIEENWYLLDLTWDSGLLNKTSDFSNQFNTNYFLTNPKLFILNHLPADPIWQLLDCPISVEDYKRNVASIQTVIKNCEKTFSFKDSIAQFENLPIAEQKRQRAKNEYAFNPTPALAKEYGHALMDYEAHLSEIAESLQGIEEHKDSLLNLQRQIINLCEEASSCTTLFSNQLENCAYNRFNYAIAWYKTLETIENEKEKQEALKGIIKELKTSKAELKTLPSNFMTEQIIDQSTQYINYLKTQLK